MCHSTDSRPPGVADPGEVREHGPLRLTSAGGQSVTAHQAIPAEPSGRNVVLLPDIRGLHPYYQALTQRFAEAGYGTVGIDYYDRTAGGGERDDSFDWQAHLPRVRPEDVAEDVRAAVAHLRSVSPGPTFTVGFCFGGSQSWRLAASDVGLAGCVGFYGRPELVRDVVPDMSAPVLLLIAGDDAATPLAESQELVDSLARAGRTHEAKVYQGAPHSFFDRAFADWQDACADAWQRIDDFTRRFAADPA